MSKPRVAVYKFSSCDGCQLGILNLEEELLDLVDAVQIAYFLEATSTIQTGPFDVILVEGSVSTEHEEKLIQKLRQDAGVLIAIGACATAGGIQSLRNFADHTELAKAIYPHPEYLHYLERATPISEHVRVDIQIQGCPVNKYQVLEVIIALLQGRKPNLPSHSVCLDCKRNGTICVMVAQDIPCAGPVTRTGCGAICPASGRGCYGCFGPSPEADMDAVLPIMQKKEQYPNQTAHLLRMFTGYAPQFRAAVDAILEESSQK